MNKVCEILIDRSVEEVSSLWLMRDKYAEWNLGYLRTEQLLGDEDAEGSVFKIYLEYSGKIYEEIGTVLKNKMPYEHTVSYISKRAGDSMPHRKMVLKTVFERSGKFTRLFLLRDLVFMSHTQLSVNNELEEEAESVKSFSAWLDAFKTFCEVSALQQ